MVNEIKYTEKHHPIGGCSFLIVVDGDTLAATAKHILTFFKSEAMDAVSFAGTLESWKMYPKDNPSDVVVVDRLINEDAEESIERVPSPKDWLLFTLKERSPNIQPLELRETPIEPGEEVTIIGWRYSDRDCRQVIYEGAYVESDDGTVLISTKELADNTIPGLSGSPVVDSRGRVIGLMSQKAGKLERLASVEYPLRILRPPTEENEPQRGHSAAPGVGSGMVLIPAGEFVMGKDEEEGETADHSPAHRVHIDAFHLDRHEVTNAQYLEFCEQTDARLPEFWGMEPMRSGPDFPDHPVVGVSWSEARQYAEWAGKRLPTEAEWEYAARGGLAGADYPFGDELQPTAANYWQWDELRSTGNGLMPVGSYPPNGYGLYDMAGNVTEWVADAYHADYYVDSPAKNPPGPEGEKFFVIRGGGWHSGPGCIRVYFRNALPGNWRDFNVGFRCAKDVE
jgi:formylglycine-generating enzyme required for sulfatase activity